MLYADKPLSETFCHDLLLRCQSSIAHGHSFNLIAMPGVGVTFFVRHLSYASPDEFIAINSYELHDFNKAALYGQLARKLDLQAAGDNQIDLRVLGTALKARTVQGKRVVLVFNRFDRLGPILDQSFFENLWFLREVSGGALVMIFVTAAPIPELASTGMQDLLRMVAETHFLRGYTADELREIMGSSAADTIEDEAIRLSGGHHALLQILTRCQDLENALSDPMVELLVKDMYLGLAPKYRRNIVAITNGKAKHVDRFLLDAGYLVAEDEKLRTFTPLLAEYARRQVLGYLPAREQRLFALLKRNAGRIVTKQEIFDTVWHEADGISSDWALNALVYRLRRNPAFDAQRYAIESYKKQGYILYDHQH